jgi:hypothetical protein
MLLQAEDFSVIADDSQSLFGIKKGAACSVSSAQTKAFSAKVFHGTIHFGRSCDSAQGLNGL